MNLLLWVATMMRGGSAPVSGVPYNKFNCFVQDVARGVHNLNADTLKVLLTNVVPVAANAVKSDLTEIAAGNGYAAGGVIVSLPGFAQVSGTGKASAVPSDPVITASGGSMAPFRYAALYNDTAASDNLIAWWDYGQSVTLAAGESIMLDVDQATGLFTLI